MDWAGLQQDARARHLCLLGGFHPTPEDDMAPGIQTLLLLGPNDPTFWPHIQTTVEWQDGTPDPVDRWSIRVINDWAATLKAETIFPFSGPPWHPFYTWALRSGRLHASPIRLLAHDTAGLFASFRGALGLPYRIELPPVPEAPCAGCAAPCATACPVNAFHADGFDIDACRGFLASDAGADCRDQGCKARRVCPTSQTWGRLPGQSAYHMRQFAR